MNRAEWNAANHAYENAKREHDKACEEFARESRIFRDGIEIVGDSRRFGLAQAVKRLADETFEAAFQVASELPQEHELSDYDENDQLTFLNI